MMERLPSFSQRLRLWPKRLSAGARRNYHADASNPFSGKVTGLIPASRAEHGSRNRAICSGRMFPNQAERLVQCAVVLPLFVDRSSPQQGHYASSCRWESGENDGVGPIRLNPILHLTYPGPRDGRGRRHAVGRLGGKLHLRGRHRLLHL
jgi:hypothetical protein